MTTIHRKEEAEDPAQIHEQEIIDRMAGRDPIPADSPNRKRAVPMPGPTDPDRA